MRFQIEFWWYFAVAAVRHGVPYLAKRAWRLLFDRRSLDWCSSPAAGAWISWSPRLGFNFDLDVNFVPGHKADLDEPDDVGYGPELSIGFGLGWFDGGLSIPNDTHEDNLISMPTHYCVCGEETQARIANYCTGCDEVDCTCELTELGRPLFM